MLHMCLCCICVYVSYVFMLHMCLCCVCVYAAYVFMFHMCLCCICVYVAYVFMLNYLFHFNEEDYYLCDIHRTGEAVMSLVRKCNLR
jgi:hypothetical protein